MKMLEDEQRKNMFKKIVFCKEYKNEKVCKIEIILLII